MRTMRGFSAIAGVIGLATMLYAQSLTWLGVLPDEGHNFSWGASVSNNGIVVGTSGQDGAWGSSERAFMWTPSSNMIRMVHTARYNVAGDVTMDGSLASLNISWEAHLWKPSTGPIYNGSPARYYGISSDGRYRVGVAVYGNEYYGWFVDGQQGQVPESGRGFYFSDVSDDGSWIVGFSATTPLTAALWQVSNWSRTVLPPLEGFPAAFARKISGNGEIIIGASTDNSDTNRKGCYWLTASPNNPTLLPSAEGNDLYREAYGIDADGSNLVGAYAINSTGEERDRFRACRWTKDANGQYTFEDLNITYGSLLNDGSILTVAFGVSANARYITGRGWNAQTQRYEAYLLDTYVPCTLPDVTGDGIVNDDDLMAILFNFGSSCGGN